MPQLSAGILVHRLHREERQVFLVHPGGPFWQKKDDGAWTIPKGEYSPGDDAKAAALREFEEETGQPIRGELTELITCKLPSGKLLSVWTVEGEVDEAAVHSNTFEMEWPPKSGRLQAFPEIDRGAWFPICGARAKINKGQIPLLDALLESLKR